MEKTRPNIVLIVADQWRGDCIGSHGHPVVETPNIDYLFQHGVAFTQAYSAVPSCIAARAALMTGLSQRSHGRVGYQDRVPWTYQTTLAGELAKAGYHTQCVGKMHVFPARSLMGFHNVVLHDGYLHTERCGEKDYDLSDDYRIWLREKYGPRADYVDSGLGCNGYTVNPWPYNDLDHPTAWVTTQAIDFLRRRDTERPFFLKVSYHRPHPPLDPPKRWYDLYCDRALPETPVGDWATGETRTSSGYDSPRYFFNRSGDQIDRARRAYYANLSFIDNQIIRLVQSLDEHGQLDNSLILFMSDHGDMLFDHGFTAKGLGYAASARVPCLMKFPEHWAGPTTHTVDAPVELRDIMPTLLAAAGVPVPAAVEGRNLIPLCTGKKDGPWREYVHGEHARGKLSNHWITNGKEMFIWYSQTGRDQYFDLEKDPVNMNDLSHKWPNRVKYLRTCLVAELKGREEGYVKAGKLVVGRKPQAVLREAGLEPR